MELNAIFLVTRLLIHIFTVYVIFMYVPQGARYKFSASVSAYLIAASSAALAVQILVNWDLLMLSQPMPWMVVFSGAILWKLWRAHGNVARMFKEKEIENGSNIG